ncbi:MAG: hypothetical protein GX777_11135 [Fastidiosipila sp.]|nr:hypothetical protein [Fastidiosipila sp.]
MDKAAEQAEVQKLSGILNVKVADKWNESNESYPGRSCQREEPVVTTNGKKSADAIVTA